MPTDSGNASHTLPHFLNPDGATATAVSANNPLPTGGGLISSGNSTTTPLGAGETFTGTGEQNSHPHVAVSGKTTATGTLFFDFSNDGTNWDSTFPVSGYKIKANTNFFHPAVKLGRYFRIRLVNDSVAQSSLRLTTYYGSGFVPANAPLNQAASLDQDAIFTRSTIPQDEIRIGRRTGVTGWTKFGYRTGLTSAGGEEIVWASSATFTPLTSASTFTITYNSTTDGADGGATGAKTLLFYYIDSDGLPAIAPHTLGSDGSDVTSFSGLGINRVPVTSSGTADSNVNAITITATTGGSTQAVIPAGGSVTQQAIYFNGSNHDAVAKYLMVNVSKFGVGTAPLVTVKAYVYSRLVDTRYEVFRYLFDTNVQTNLEISEPVGFNLSPTDVLYFVADTDQNSTDIVVRFSLNEYQRT